MEELIEKSIREMIVLDSSKFKDCFSYVIYLSSLVENAYNRGMDVNEIVSRILPVAYEEEFYAVDEAIINIVIENNDLELARNHFNNMHVHKGDSWMFSFIRDWLLAGKDRNILTEFVKSLPDLDYIEVLIDAIGFETNIIHFILEVGGDKINYIELMNNDRFEETETEDILMEIIENQV